MALFHLRTCRETKAYTISSMFILHAQSFKAEKGSNITITHIQTYTQTPTHPPTYIHKQQHHTKCICAVHMCFEWTRCLGRFVECMHMQTVGYSSSPDACPLNLYVATYKYMFVCIYSTGPPTQKTFCCIYITIILLQHCMLTCNHSFPIHRHTHIYICVYIIDIEFVHVPKTETEAPGSWRFRSFLNLADDAGWAGLEGAWRAHRAT